VPSHKISERAFDFACRIVPLYRILADRGGAASRIANQLLSSATSIGANLEEAEAGQTKRDFIARQCVARKEARETIYWLRLLVATDLVLPREVASELDDAKQLLAMLTSSILTAQSSSERG
jgi:four helix bundle protein